MPSKQWDPERSISKDEITSSQYTVQPELAKDDYKADIISLSNKLKGVDIDNLLKKTTEVILEHSEQANDVIEYLFMISEDPIEKFTNVAKELQQAAFLNPRRLDELNGPATTLWEKITFLASPQNKTTYSVVEDFEQHIVMQTKINPSTFVMPRIKSRIPKWSIQLLHEDVDTTYTESCVDFTRKNFQLLASGKHSLKMARMNHFLARNSHNLYKYYRLLLARNGPDSANVYAANLELVRLYALFLSNENNFAEAKRNGVLSVTAGCLQAFKRIANDIPFTEKRILYTKYSLNDTNLMTTARVVEGLARGIVVMDVNLAIFLAAILAFIVAYMNAIWARASSFISFAELPKAYYLDHLDWDPTMEADRQFKFVGLQDVLLDQVKDAIVILLSIVIGASAISRLILSTFYLNKEV